MHFDATYQGKTVLVTGHTGFKGAWLCEWLLLCGARVIGFSCDIPTTPSLFSVLQLESRICADLRGDICSPGALRDVLETYQPDFVFHFAAQSLVGRSYTEPLLTIDTNVMGSVQLLEALRLAQRPCVAVLITTDKVYENREWDYAYREHDPLGGYDPYSASKACADILIASYQRSFFAAHAGQGPTIAVASARGGNVIGGGDWAANRIVPDCMRSLAAQQPIPVRNRHATRPWQHVLELLSGYMLLGAQLHQASTQHNHERLVKLCSAFNFGPLITSNKPVQALVQEVLCHWPGSWHDMTDPSANHEAGRLNLTIDKAYHTLGWHPRWNFEETIAATVAWYRRYYENAADSLTMQTFTQQQLCDFSARVVAEGTT
ncbi:MAG: CDP-glucose 4,6-dehydratase [Chloroflexaceae bacterium]|jgi:CDP-glucose 4,6-dehydratase|nr:CDP-glucose 4,6-dehydratase [Chloroflexaceae bacterium]